MAKGVALHVRPPQDNEEAKGHSGVEAKACTESNRTQSGFDLQAQEDWPVGHTAARRWWPPNRQRRSRKGPVKWGMWLNVSGQGGI